MDYAVKGSKKYTQLYINEHRQMLNCLIFSASPGLTRKAVGEPVWVSPLKAEQFNEYYDGPFLDALGLGKHKAALKEFWPDRGPHWDALAKVETDAGPGAILVEAKAHLSESKRDDESKAGDESATLINESLLRARKFYGVPDSAPSWFSTYYQVCNRLAHLYFMNEVLGVPTWLVWLLIADDPDWAGEDPANPMQWRDHFISMYAEIGIDASCLDDRVITVYAPPVK